MSLLKWKEMAEKRSELGKKINTVRDTIKQKKISDQMGEVEAEKLFKPITSELKELTAPKAPLRRLVKKKRPVPDYGIAIDDEVPDYGLDDLFDQPVLPENEKQIVPKPPSYEDVLEDLASGKKQMYIDPEYMYEPEDLPPEYEEEVPDYEILEEDRINQALDQLQIPNYDDIELQLQQEDMNDKKRKSYLTKTLKKAKEKRQQLPGFLSDISKKLKSGSITEAEAQYQRKIIQDTRKVLTDYMNYHQQKLQKLKSIKGSGLKKKTKRGGQVMFFNNPTEMMKKLELIIGSKVAGNNSIELRNTGVALLDILLRNSILNKPQYNKIYKNYFSLN